MPASTAGPSGWPSSSSGCLGDLMIVLDPTIVNVALPRSAADLGFAETSLVWVVNAYMLTFGGFPLLGGKLSDIFRPPPHVPDRHRGLHDRLRRPAAAANSQGMLIVARAAQGSAAPWSRRSRYR